MPRNTTDVCLSLRPETLKAIDAAAQIQRRSRSQFVDLTLEKALTGQGRLDALQAMADAGLAEYESNANAPRALNATEVIASPEYCADGRGRLAALEKIAAGKRKA